MTPETLALAGGGVFFVAITSVAVWLIDRRKVSTRLLRHPSIFSLSLLSTLGVVFSLGTVEMAGRYGLLTLLMFFAFTVPFVLAPMIIRPTQWVTLNRKFTSLVDLLVFRYRGLRSGQFLTLATLLVLLPLAMAQLRAVDRLLALLLGEWAGKFGSLAVATVSALFIGLPVFGPGGKKLVVPILALLNSLMLVAILAAGLLAIFSAFDGYQGMESWIEQTGQNQAIKRFDFTYAFIAAFLVSGMVMPQIFYLLSHRRDYARPISYASWLFPLLVFASCLPMFPILWAGLFRNLDVPLQYYALELTRSLDQSLLGILVVAGILSAATGAMFCLTLTIAKPTVSYLVIPNRLNKPQNLHRWLHRWERQVSGIWLIACVLATQFSHSSSITNLTLVAMTGLVQFSPALIAAFYFPKIYRLGVLSGLGAGLSLWFIGLFLPMFSGDWVWLSDRMAFSITFGISNWHNWLTESLVLNLAICILVSRYGRVTSEEKAHALACQVDFVPIPQRVAMTQHSLTEIRNRLAGLIGDRGAELETQRALETLQLSEDENRPYALRLIRDQLKSNLYELLGTAVAEDVIERAIPLSKTPASEADDIQLIETELARNASHLQGMAIEINKLRLHHRKTLFNLPIAVCNLGDDGEITLWNTTMESYTGIPATGVTGGRLSEVTEPWGRLLGEFAAGYDPHRYAVRIDLENTPHWFNFHRTLIDREEPGVLSNQTILLEDVTERIHVSRELMHTERLASVGRLAAGVAHEIGNPVAGIACLAQDLREETDDPDAIETANLILYQTKRISQILHSLIGYSRSGEVDTHRPVMLREIVDSAINLLKLQRHEHQIDYLNQVAENLYTLGDPHQLTQVFLNLISNARDACETRGSVRITGEVQENPENDELLLSVIDDGHGIDVELMGKVFEPFFTTKPVGEGTGLGLSLVYSIVDRHKGRIHIRSPLSDKRGTCVEVRLPRHHVEK